MLVNGTEVLNYKGADVVYFGPLERLNILNSGQDYDAQNPPNIIITDESVSVANTAGAVAVVSGNVKNIFIDPTEFDIDKVTSIEIFGGNGSGAIARAFLEERFREVFFSGVSTNLGGNTRSFNDTLPSIMIITSQMVKRSSMTVMVGQILVLEQLDQQMQHYLFLMVKYILPMSRVLRSSLYTTIKTMLLQVSTALPLMRTLS